jgi:hypothetical protein
MQKSIHNNVHCIKIKEHCIHKSMVHTHTHDTFTLKCGRAKPSAHSLDVLVGVGHHDEVPNLAHCQGTSGAKATDLDGGRVVTDECPLPLAAIDGYMLTDDLGPPIVVLVGNAPQEALNDGDLHAPGRW